MENWNEVDWNKYVSTLLKVELKKRDISYAELSEKLKEIGIEVTAQHINSKLNRGTFGAVY